MFDNDTNSFNASPDTTTQKAAEALSVSAALSLAKGTLEQVVVSVIGEVSEVSCKPGYKAAYFTVKDKSASLPCMMWMNRFQATGIQMAVGQLVEITGRFSLYAAKGRMNFDVFSLSLAGEGKLRQQVADLARKLEAEGLMDAQRKLALPAYPTRIGLVTSPRGAAVHDVLRTLRRRFPLANVVVAGVPVEGRDAPAHLVQALRAVYDAGVEVALLVRGGGSFEDLMPFNDERLARTIAACPIPVITGIGHEPDTSIADMVADVRASTPTAAAETVAPASESLVASLEAQGRALATAMSRRLEREQALVVRRAERPLFQDATYLFAAPAQTLDYLSEHLFRALPANIERDHTKLATTATRLQVALPSLVSRRALQIDALRSRMIVRGRALPDRFKTQIGVSAARLNDLSPLAILSRGYAMVRSDEGTLVKAVEQVEVGAKISVSISNGELACEVVGKQNIETTIEEWEGSE